MSREPLRVGVVGAGFIATKKHLPSWSSQGPDARVVAIADRDEAAARDAGARFGDPATYPGLTEMLAAERLDVVDICSPPRLHHSMALEAIEAGCHVLIEKPMAVTVEECDGIIVAAQERDVRVSVAHTDLFYPPFVKARQVVARGGIGRFTGMRIFLSTPTDYMTSRQDHWAHRLPGGVIGESGPHVVYLTLAFINPVREIWARGERHLDFPWSRFDDYRIELGGAQGRSTITSVYTSNQWAANVDIWGTAGMLRLDLQVMSLVRTERDRFAKARLAASGLREAATVARDTVATGIQTLTGSYRNTHDILIQRFVASIRGGRPVPVPPEDGREAVRVMTEIARQLDGD